MQWHATLAVVFVARHFGAAQTTAAAHAHAGGAGTHGAGQSALHGAAETDPVLELLGDGLRHQHGVELRPLDLDDVDLHALLGHRMDLFAQRIDFGAALADHDARPCGVDVDGDGVLVLADDDARQAGVGELAQDVRTDPLVLGQELLELFLCIPVRFPVVDDTDSEAARMYLLAH